MRTTMAVVVLIACVDSAAAQTRPPTVNGVHPSEIRLPTAREAGIAQLLAHSSSASGICPAGQTLAVINRTRQIVCWVRMETGCKQATDSFRNGLDQAEAKRRQLDGLINTADKRVEIMQKEVNAANIKDNQLGNQAEAESDTAKKLAIYQEQLEHKQKLLQLVRDRNYSEQVLDDLQRQWDQVLNDIEQARSNLQRATNNTPSCYQNQQPSNWLSDRIKKGVEYALADPQLKELMRDALVSAVANGSQAKLGTKLSDPMQLLEGIATEFRRGQYAYEKGFDANYWSSAFVKSAELYLSAQAPGVSKAMPWFKLSAAFGTSFAYGFAVAP